MYYAAYGSNINLEQMAFRCPNSKVVGVGRLNNWKLYFNYHADIKHTGEEKDVVPVLIWDIADEDWMMLDKYEGYPVYYVKVNVPVVDLKNQNQIVNCIVYVMSENSAGEFDFPSVTYYNCIADGYISNRMDLKYLEDALVYTAQEIEKRKGRFDD